MELQSGSKQLAHMGIQGKNNLETKMLTDKQTEKIVCFGFLCVFSFWLGLHFLCPAQFLANWFTPMSETSFNSAPPAQLYVSSHKYPFWQCCLLSFLT